VIRGYRRLVPVEWFIAWLGARLGSTAVNAGWRRVEQLLGGEPGNRAFASAFTRAVRETADEVVSPAGNPWMLQEGIENAFREADTFGERGDLVTVEASLTSSIHATRESSALNSEAVPGGRQLEILAKGMAIEDLADILPRHFIRCIKLEESVGGPLSSLAAQLNSNAVAREQKEGARSILEAIENLQAAAALGAVGDGISRQMSEILRVMEVIHPDYLRAFADAEQMLDQGTATSDFLHFLRQLQAARADVRLMAIARAKRVLTDDDVSQLASPRQPAAGEFAEAVVAYFGNASTAGKVTYFTDLIGYMEGILTMAESAGSSGPQDVSMMYMLTADEGTELRGRLKVSRSKLQADFTRVATAYAAFEACA
jgi:hypothetical protein